MLLPLVVGETLLKLKDKAPLGSIAGKNCPPVKVMLLLEKVEVPVTTMDPPPKSPESNKVPLNPQSQNHRQSFFG